MNPLDPIADPIALADRVLAPTYRRPPVVFRSGQGCWLEDEGGQRYLDMTSGIAVTSLGHGSPTVANALRRAADGLTHTSNLFHTAPAIALAQSLVDASFAEQVFFCNSGAEAVEGAVKFARLAGGSRREIVYFDGAFHGRTLGALAATDRPEIREPFEPLPLGFRRAPFNDDDALTLVDTDVAAVLIEPIQGEGGVRVPDPAWLQRLRNRCTEVGALLIVDEIQCGLGRTGRLWAHEHAAVVPDLMTLAKPLAGGLPMGAVLLGPAAASAVTPSSHGSTFGGGPVVAQVAQAVFDEINQPDFLKGVQERSALLQQWLTEALGAHLEEVRGVGLLLGVKLTGPHTAAEVSRAAFEARLLLVPAAGNVLRLLPPLNAPLPDLEQAVARLARVVKEMAS